MYIGMDDVLVFDNSGVKIIYSTGRGDLESRGSTDMKVVDFGRNHGYTSATSSPRFVADVDGDGKNSKISKFLKNTFLNFKITGRNDIIGALSGIILVSFQNPDGTFEMARPLT